MGVAVVFLWSSWDLLPAQPVRWISDRFAFGAVCVAAGAIAISASKNIDAALRFPGDGPFGNDDGLMAAGILGAAVALGLVGLALVVKRRRIRAALALAICTALLALLQGMVINDFGGLDGEAPPILSFLFVLILVALFSLPVAAKLRLRPTELAGGPGAGPEVSAVDIGTVVEGQSSDTTDRSVRHVIAIGAIGAFLTATPVLAYVAFSSDEQTQFITEATADFRRTMVIVILGVAAAWIAAAAGARSLRERLWIAYGLLAGGTVISYILFLFSFFSST